MVSHNPNTKQSIASPENSSSTMDPVNTTNIDQQSETSDDETSSESSGPDELKDDNIMTETESEELTKLQRKYREEQQKLMTKQLSKAGIMTSSNVDAIQIQKDMSKIVLRYIKFAENEQLEYDGDVAQVIFSHMNENDERKITDECWKEYWPHMAKFLKKSLKEYRSYRSRQIGQILIGK